MAESSGKQANGSTPLLQGHLFRFHASALLPRKGLREILLQGSDRSGPDRRSALNCPQ